MEYRLINGKSVSQISLGTVQLGMNYGIANNAGRPSEEKSFEMLSTALSNGITAIDTARLYGESEDVLGRFFAGYKGKMPFITTKYKCLLDENATYAQVESEVFSSVETSLEKLGLEKIDCLLLHNTPVNGILHGEKIAKAFTKLKEQKLVDITGFSMARFSSELGIMLELGDAFQAVQVPMNIFDLRVLKEGYLDKLIKKNIHVFVRSVFFQGLFFLDPSNMRTPELQSLAGPYLMKLREIANGENMSVPELAIAFIRDLGGVTSLVLGADTKEQVASNIAYINTPKISDRGWADIIEVMKDVDILGIMAELAKPKQ